MYALDFNFYKILLYDFNLFTMFRKFNNFFFQAILNNFFLFAKFYKFSHVCLYLYFLDQYFIYNISDFFLVKSNHDILTIII